MSQRRGKKVILLAGTLLILSGFGYLIYGNIGSNLTFFRTPTELHELGEKAFDRPVRLGGLVVPGSVRWDAERLDLRFVMTDENRKVTVHSSKSPPQMFREGMGVIVEGRLNKEGIFESNNVMVKHSNEYKAPPPGHKPQDVYKSLVRDKVTT